MKLKGFLISQNYYILLTKYFLIFQIITSQNFSRVKVDVINRHLMHQVIYKILHNLMVKCIINVQHVQNYMKQNPVGTDIANTNVELRKSFAVIYVR